MLPERTTKQQEYVATPYGLPQSREEASRNRSASDGPNGGRSLNAQYSGAQSSGAQYGSAQYSGTEYNAAQSRDREAWQRTARDYSPIPRRTHQNNEQMTDTSKDLLIGLLGGAAGVIAMDLFSQKIMPMLTQSDEQNDEQNASKQKGNGQEQQTEHALDSISVIGEHHRPNESSTAALGRILYHWTTDENPDKSTKSTLSYLVHWGYGIAQGGVYATMRGPVSGSDLLGGMAFGSGLWLFGDELAVPMLGLQDGPTAEPISTHANRLAMHLVYGVTTAATVQWLRRMMA